MPRVPVPVLVAFALSLSGCTALLQTLRGTVEPPRAVFRSAALTGIDLDAATIDAQFRLENPNPVGVTLQRLTWAFSLDGTRVVDGTLPGGLRLAPSGSTPLVLPVRVPFASVPGLLTTFAGRDEAPYVVEGRATVRTPLGDVAIPLRFKGMLPIPKLPTVALRSVRIESLSLVRGRLGVALSVTNPNVFPLPLEALTARLSVAGQPVASLGLDASRMVGPKETVELQLPVDVSFAGAGVAVLGAIQAGSARVGLAGEAKVGGRWLPLDLSTTLAAR